METFDKRFDNHSQLIAHERKKLQQKPVLMATIKAQSLEHSRN
jgi:hypothetical protein